MLIWASDANFIPSKLVENQEGKNMYSALIQAAASTCAHHCMTKHLFAVM